MSNPVGKCISRWRVLEEEEEQGRSKRDGEERDADKERVEQSECRWDKYTFVQKREERCYEYEERERKREDMKRDREGAEETPEMSSLTPLTTSWYGQTDMVITKSRMDFTLSFHKAHPFYDSSPDIHSPPPPSWLFVDVSFLWKESCKNRGSNS